MSFAACRQQRSSNVNDVKQKTGAAGSAEEFVITRVFAAPRRRMWQAWTDPAQLEKWWGPKGFKAKVVKLDLKPGGIFHYRLTSPQGQEMWGKFVYREIVPEERLVFLSSFSDKAGGVTRHPMAPDWPLQMLSTISFAEKDGRTTVTVRWEPYEATEAERKVFTAGHESMTGGWTGTLDQLEAYLSKT
jgi:uncharacterized protein YndB with AHSA1/START domain